jgi:acyl-CoA thioesterase
MRAELADPAFRVVSATTLFCSPVPNGPVEIRVHVIRRGGAAVQMRAALSSTSLPGPGLEVSATFARDRDGIEMIDARFPEVADPDDCPSAIDDSRRNPHTWARFFRNFEIKLARGDRFWDQGWSGGEARYARWMRYRTAQGREDGTLDPLAIPPIADTMPPSLRQKLGPSNERFIAPSLDLTVHFLQPTRSEWLLVSAYSRRARGGVATAEVEIWSQERELVAYGTQMMFLRNRPEGL